MCYTDEGKMVSDSRAKNEGRLWAKLKKGQVWGTRAGRVTDEDGLGAVALTSDWWIHIAQCQWFDCFILSSPSCPACRCGTRSGMGSESDLRLSPISWKAQISCGLARLPSVMATVQESEELRQPCSRLSQSKTDDPVQHRKSCGANLGRVRIVR